jgi:hypothetical protein
MSLEPLPESDRFQRGVENETALFWTSTRVDCKMYGMMVQSSRFSSATILPQESAFTALFGLGGKA